MLTELLILMSLFIASWLAVRMLRRRFQQVAAPLGASPNSALDAPRSPPFFSNADWNLLALPALLLPGVLIGRAVLKHWQSVHLLDLTVPLLLSFLAIQSAIFLLRRAFPPSEKLLAVQRVISWLVWGALALHISGYLGEVISTLDAVGFDVGKQRISLYTVMMGVLSLAVTLVFALWLARMIENRLEKLPLHANMRLALGKLARSVLLLLAVLTALPLVGIDITVLSVFGGALGVGLGLGLQKIAANYVSGFTLLLDQSIRIGDMVTVGDRYGEVTQIATRYTVIKGLDGAETIVPNEAMITAAVTNHSLSTPDNRVDIPVQVSYQSDLRTVEKLLIEIARDNGRVMQSREPTVRLMGFGENGIDLRLVVWANHPEEGQIALISDINWKIWETFQREGIEIPFPQRVIHIQPTTTPAPRLS